MDHSEIAAAELRPVIGETAEQKNARIQTIIENRVPDIRFLLDYLLHTSAWQGGTQLDSSQIGIVGHSFGGWAALAVPDREDRIRAIVALAPGGSSKRKAGTLPLELAFDWRGNVPTLYLVAENDASMPLAGMYELFERTPASKHMVILRRADHSHFMDNVEQSHEAFRTRLLAPELAKIQEEMLPVAELCSGQQAHSFVRGYTLSHMDAILRGHKEAQQFLACDTGAEMAHRGIEVIVHNAY